MALVTCPDCGKQISDAAVSCMECGRPMRGLAEPKVLVEQSAKPYKAGILVGILMIVIGPLLASGGSQEGVVRGGMVLVLGVLVLIFSLIARWWQHG